MEILVKAESFGGDSPCQKKWDHHRVGDIVQIYPDGTVEAVPSNYVLIKAPGKPEELLPYIEKRKIEAYKVRRIAELPNRTLRWNKRVHTRWWQLWPSLFATKWRRYL